MKKKEVLIIGIILLVAIVGLIVYYFINKDKVLIEVTYYDSGSDTTSTLMTFDLNKDAYYTFEVPYGIYHIEVKDGQYRAVDVDCPNQTCVHVGWVPSMGIYSPIICIPNGITIAPLE